MTVPTETATAWLLLADEQRIENQLQERESAKINIDVALDSAIHEFITTRETQGVDPMQSNSTLIEREAKILRQLFKSHAEASRQSGFWQSATNKATRLELMRNISTYGKVLADTLKPQIKIEKEDRSNEAQTPTPIRI